MGTLLASSDDENMVKLWKNKKEFEWECISSIKVYLLNKGRTDIL